MAVFLAARRHGGFRLRRIFCAASARSMKSQWPSRARSSHSPQVGSMTAILGGRITEEKRAFQYATGLPGLGINEFVRRWR